MKTNEILDSLTREQALERCADGIFKINGKMICRCPPRLIETAKYNQCRGDGLTACITCWEIAINGHYDRKEAKGSMPLNLSSLTDAELDKTEEVYRSIIKEERDSTTIIEAVRCKLSKIIKEQDKRKAALACGK